MRMSTSEPKVVKSDQEWREQLTPEQYDVLRKAGTEPPFTGDYVYNKDAGDYRCAACDAVLFGADTKFESGTGWPSFTEPAVAEAVELRPDNSLFMRRTEVICATAAGISATCSTTAPGRRASATASTRRRCRPAARAQRQAGAGTGVRQGRAAPLSIAFATMIMLEQSRRLSEPLRWGRREKTIVAVVVAAWCSR